MTRQIRLGRRVGYTEMNRAKNGRFPGAYSLYSFSKLPSSEPKGRGLFSFLFCGPGKFAAPPLFDFRHDDDSSSSSRFSLPPYLPTTYNTSEGGGLCAYFPFAPRVRHSKRSLTCRSAVPERSFFSSSTKRDAGGSLTLAFVPKQLQ